MANDVQANAATTAGAVFATFNVSSVQTPVSLTGHKNVVTLRTNFTAAQTNVALVTPTSGSALAILEVFVATDNAGTTSPSIRIGTGATTPTGAGCVYSHPGLPSGFQGGRGNGGGILAIGATDAPLRVTSTVATGGSIDVLVSYVEVQL